MKAFKIRNSSALLGVDLKSTVRILEESCRTLKFQMKADGNARVYWNLIKACWYLWPPFLLNFHSFLLSFLLNFHQKKKIF